MTAKYVVPLLSFIGAIFGTFIGYQADLLDFRNKDRATDVEVMKFAFSVYATDRTVTGDNLRVWACETIAYYSNGVALDCSDDSDAISGEVAPSTVGGLERTLQGPANATDIDVFICNRESTTKAANELIDRLRDVGFGRLRIRDVDGVPSVVAGADVTRVYVDQRHPERWEVGRLSSEIGHPGLGLPTVKVEANSGALTPWLISVSFCLENSG